MQNSEEAMLLCRDDSKCPAAGTEDDQEADEDGGQRAHAQPQDLGLLHQLAVGAGVAAGAEAGVALGVVAVTYPESVFAELFDAGGRYLPPASAFPGRRWPVEFDGGAILHGALHFFALAPNLAW